MRETDPRSPRDKYLSLEESLETSKHCQGIYRIDPNTLIALDYTRIGDLPSEALSRLPKSCIYIEIPECERYRYEWQDASNCDLSHICGYWVHFEWKQGTDGLRLLLECDSYTHREMKYIETHLQIGNWPITGTIQRFIDKNLCYSRIAYCLSSVALREQIERLVKPLLYLCSESLEISKHESESEHGAIPVWDVGIQTGQHLELCEQWGTLLTPLLDILVRGGKQPTLGSWEGRWSVSSPAGEQIFVHRWIPPMGVQPVSNAYDQTTTHTLNMYLSITMAENS